jgi:hypothetical protein
MSSFFEEISQGFMSKTVVPVPVPPQFALPFRLTESGFAQVDQDSEDDINYCVEAVMRFHPGDRAMLPEFGIRDLAFSEQPIDGANLIAEVAQHEPRAQIYVDSQPNRYDPLWAEVTVGVAIEDQTEKES